MPKSDDVGTNMKRLKAKHPDMPHAQMVAIAISEAREMTDKKHADKRPKKSAKKAKS